MGCGEGEDGRVGGAGLPGECGDQECGLPPVCDKDHRRSCSLPSVDTPR